LFCVFLQKILFESQLSIISSFPYVTPFNDPAMAGFDYQVFSEINKTFPSGNVIDIGPIFNHFQENIFSQLFYLFSITSVPRVKLIDAQHFSLKNQASFSLWFFLENGMDCLGTTYTFPRLYCNLRLISKEDFLTFPSKDFTDFIISILFYSPFTLKWAISLFRHLGQSPKCFDLQIFKLYILQLHLHL
jgi:hypothetical protein